MSIRIGHISQHSCPRIHKVSYALQKRGFTNLWATDSKGFTHAHPVKHYPFCYQFNKEDGDSIHEAIRQLDPLVDIWWAHNEPNHFMYMIHQRSKKPVIWDCHDFTSMRDGQVTQHEDYCLSFASHIFAPSAPLAQHISDFTAIPVTHYSTKVPRDWYPKPAPARRDEMVLVSGLGEGYGHWRAWHFVLEKVLERVKVTAYSGQGTPKKLYQQFADVVPLELRRLFVYPPVPMLNMYNEIAQFQSSLIGAPFPNAHVSVAEPNKLWEALAAATPIICFNNAGRLHMADLVEEHRLGIVVTDPEKLADAHAELRESRAHLELIEKRDDFSMDKEIEKIVPVLEGLV